MEREKEIVLAKVPDIAENLADQVARVSAPSAGWN